VEKCRAGGGTSRMYLLAGYIRSMSQKPLQISYNLADIHAAAHQLWQWAYPLRVFAFSGSLGAGKTTFIHALCDTLGVKDAVSSPTFALINEYRFRDGEKEQTIYHMDWYRLRDADEAVDAGMEDALNNDDVYCFIEWPEKAPELLQKAYVRVHLEATDMQQRMLTATAVE
jgi:tRNA threonylcarbamoyladenosine biosynthesis protein TsaE